MGVKKPKAGILQGSCVNPTVSLCNKIWSMRKTSTSLLTGATVQCDAARRELLLCHAASLVHKTGPKDL